MKKILVAVVLLGLVVLTLIPAGAFAAPLDGWQIRFSIDDGTSNWLYLGANDGGSGFSRVPIQGTVNGEIYDGFSGIIYQGAMTQFTNQIILTPQANHPAKYILNYQPYNWDSLWYYQPGDLDPQYTALGLLEDTDQILDFSTAGSIELDGSKLTRIQFYGNMPVPVSPVPEPGTLVSLGSMITGFGFVRGAVRKRVFERRR